MKLIKIIFTQSNKIKDDIIKLNNFDEKVKNDDFTILEWYRNIYKDEESVVLVYFNSFNKALSYVKDNYDIFKIIIAWLSDKIWNFDLNPWDVIIPNTFINKSSPDAIFIEYASWENYNLTKFWLVLSWLCISWKPEVDDTFDIWEENIYDNLNEIKNLNLINKTIVVFWIKLEENREVENNVSSVIELLL